MIREITLSLDEFGRAAVELYAERHRHTPSDLVRLALLHYLDQAGSGRAAVAYPKLLRPSRFSRASDGTPALELSMDLESEEWEALASHATREGVALQALFRHAVLLYIADLEAGSTR